MTNFAFLQAEWALVFEAAKQAEHHTHGDARSACFYARRALELAVNWLYTHDKALKLPYQDNLSALIHEPSFRQVVGDALFTKARLVKDLGNLAVHSTKKVAGTDALSATRELFHFCFWLARTYGRAGRPDPGLSFKAELLPKPQAPSVAAPTAEQLKKLGEQLREKDDKLSEVLASHAALDAELQKLRDEVAAAKKANSAVPDTHDYSEAETRRAFIDLLLREAGWTRHTDGLRDAQGQPLTLTLRTFPDRPELPIVATALQEQWRQAGLAVQVRIGNSGDIPLGHRDGTLQLALMARNYGSIPDVAATLLQDFGPNGGDWGAMGWQHPEVTDALTRLDRLPGAAAEAQALRRRVVRILHEELPVIPVAWYRQQVAVSQRVRDVSLDPLERSHRISRMRWNT